MRKTENEKLLDALDFIDEVFIGETEKYYLKKDTNTGKKSARIRNFLAVGAALAACVLIVLLAIPKTETVITSSDTLIVFSPTDSGEIIEHTRKGSDGLLYEISEDGKSAYCVGFGTCTDETVYVASTYEGLPVTEVYYEKYGNSSYGSYYQSKLKHVKSIVISDSVRIVEPEFISVCPNIESVYYGASVENIKGFRFNTGYGSKFTRVEVSPDNPYYSDEGNCIVDLRTNALVLATYKSVIPDDGSIVIIAENAFTPAAFRLGSVTIPEGVRFIDRFAFWGCYRLESITLPESLEVIEAEVFDGCDNLKKIELGSNLISVDQTVFQYYKAPDVYYNGTVAEWEAVLKFNSTSYSVRIVYDADGNATKYYTSMPITFPAFTVKCTDGVSNSDAGTKGYYAWKDLPEFEEYESLNKSTSAYWTFTSGGEMKEVLPWREKED